MVLGANKDYPYMYARVSAKKAKLLDNSDYEKFLKMQPNQIAKNLGEGEYKEDIDALGSNYDGVRLVELALTRNLARSLTELIEIAPENLENILEAYLRRYDILSLKRLLRWKMSDSEIHIDEIITPVSSFSYDELKELSEKEFEEIVENIDFDSDVDYSSYLQGADTVSEIEKGLDQAYFDELSLLSKKMHSKELTDFLERELKHQNLTVALRLKRQDEDEDQIRERMIKNGKSQTLEGVISAESYQEALEVLKDEGRIEDTDKTLEDIEKELEVERLDKALRMLHTEPLGLTSIIGYIVAKIVEVENLRMLIRAKETEIHNMETIRRNLVVAGR